MAGRGPTNDSPISNLMPSGIYPRSNKQLETLKKQGFQTGHPKFFQISFHSLESRKRIQTKIFLYWKSPEGIVRKNPLLRSHHNHDFRYRNWRNSVFKRDNWTCRACGSRSKAGNPIYLEAHHIKSWKLFPKLRYKIENGITFCDFCHLLYRSSESLLCLL